MLIKAIIFYIFLFNLLFSKGQTTQNEISIGFGSIAYSNAFSLPSGLPGGSYSLNFHKDKLRVNKSFSYNVRVQYNRLFRKDILSPLVSEFPFHLGELGITGMWGREMPISLLGVDFWLEFGPSLNGMLFGRTPGSRHFHNEISGFWYISANTKMMFIKEFGLNSLQGHLHLPLLLAGHFQEYQGGILGMNFGENLVYYASPNSIVFFTNFFSPDISISGIRFLNNAKNTGIKLSYNFQYLNSNINNNSINKINSTVMIGIVLTNK